MRRRFFILPIVLDGTFSVTQAIVVGDMPVDVCLTDIDGNGTLDLAVGSSFGGDGILDLVLADNIVSFGGGISVLPGLGDGNLDVVADVNADGALEVLVGQSGNGGSIAVLLGNGDGTLGAATFFGNQVGRSLATADIDRDGQLDVISTGFTGFASVLFGQGDGTFTGQRNFATETNTEAVAVADLNGDKLPDIAVANFDPNKVTTLISQLLD